MSYPMHTIVEIGLSVDGGGHEYATYMGKKHSVG